MKVLCTDYADIAVPAERAFSFVTDVSRWPLWFSPVVCAQQPQDLPLALDEELLLCLHTGRRRWQETFEITRFLRNAFFSLEGSFSAARRIDFRFEQRAAQTRVACSIGYPVFGGIIPALLDATLARPRVRRQLRESVTRLKGLLEEPAESASFAESFIEELHASAAAPEQEPVSLTQAAGAV